jgi:hypothetical protein
VELYLRSSSTTSWHGTSLSTGTTLHLPLLLTDVCNMAQCRPTFHWKRWAVHVARMGNHEIRTKFCLDSLKGKKLLEIQGVDKRII